MAAPPSSTAGAGDAAAGGGEGAVGRPYVDLPISIGRLRVLRGFQTLSWALAVVWIFAVIHPDLGLSVQRKISYDENAVSPTTPLPVLMTQEDLAPYLNAQVEEALKSAASSEADWFAGELKKLGLAPTEHKFHCPDGRQARSIYTVLRPTYTQGNEALVLAAPLPRHGTRVLGAATALAVARVASQTTWMSKSVVLLGFDATSCDAGGEANELGAGRDAIEAWLDDYYRPGALQRHGGLLREAIVLDLDGKTFAVGNNGQTAKGGTLATLSVLHEGWGAAMPNLDMMATVVVQTQETLAASVMHVGTAAGADTLSEWLAGSVAGQVQHGCSTDMFPPPRTAPHPLDSLASPPRRGETAGHDRMPWWAGWRCLTSALLRVAGGAPPHGAHAPFLQRNIDAVTLLGRSSAADYAALSDSQLLAGDLRPTSARYPLKPLDICRTVESICRGLSNIAEEFHHARPSYIMLTPSQLVEDVWFVVPQLILLGNLLFPILVYGYFVSSVHARGAAALILELAGVAIASATLAHVFLVPYVLQLQMHPATSSDTGKDYTEEDQGAAMASAATYWLVSWLLYLVLLSRYDTAPGDLEQCASERIRLAVELIRANPTTATADYNLRLISTIQEEAAALLEPGVGEAVEGNDEEVEGKTSQTFASFMVARTAVYLWLFVGLSVSFVNHYVIGFLIAAVALPAHTLPLPPVWGYFPDKNKRGLFACCCGRIEEAPLPPRRPARSFFFRLWMLLLSAAQAAHSPPVLLALWVYINECSVTAASTALVQMVKIYAAAPAGCTPWLPFLVLVHTPLHALGTKLQWDRRALLSEPSKPSEPSEPPELETEPPSEPTLEPEQRSDENTSLRRRSQRLTERALE